MRSDRPPWFIEYGYYVWLFYAIMGVAVGISFPLLGVGLLLMLTVYCVVHLRSPVFSFYRPIVFPLAAGVSLIAIDFVYHGGSLGETSPIFVPWLCHLILTYSLSQRQGFLHRFALAALLLGICVLPYLNISYNSGTRAGLDREISLANPNDLSAWFGFVAVYFALLGIEGRRDLVRMISFLIALGCLFVVALTVSRGPILCGAAALVVGCRRLLKRGFFPVLILVILVWAVSVSGVFDKGVVNYEHRGLEDSGRLVVWPAAIERYLTSPLMGFGLSNLAVPLPGGPPVTPHNSFLAVALVSGIVPLFFYFGYWWRAARGAFTTNTETSNNAAFELPLLVYAFLEAQQLNFPFISAWIVVTLSSIIAHHSSARAQVTVRQAAGGRTGNRSGRLINVRSALRRGHFTLTPKITELGDRQK